MGAMNVQESAECNAAKDTFGGRLTQDFVAERLNTSNFTDIREMDFPNLGIKNVDIGGGDVFTNLRRFEKLLSFHLRSVLMSAALFEHLSLFIPNPITVM